MKYDVWVNSDRFESYVGDKEAWESLPAPMRAEIATTGANIKGVKLD